MRSFVGIAASWPETGNSRNDEKACSDENSSRAWFHSSKFQNKGKIPYMVRQHFEGAPPTQTEIYIFRVWSQSTARGALAAPPPGSEEESQGCGPLVRLRLVTSLVGNSDSKCFPGAGT